MKRALWLVLLVVLVAGNLGLSLTHLRPVHAADGAVGTGEASLLQIPGLKAVLIVGPIDGDNGYWTQQEMAHMELAAVLLEAQGVAVHRFYTPNNDWQAITEAARGAHFLLYRGHGPAWNSRPDVGGFALRSRIVTPAEIASGLSLAPNAIVMIYACYSAGSSGMETYDIGIDEARRRVLQYSAPFVELGIAGYFANWYGDAFEQFLRYLYMGRSLGDAYRSYFDYNPETAQHATHPDDDAIAVWLDRDNWYGYWQYHNAFLGGATATLIDLFGVPELGGIPERLHFVYSLSENRYLVDAYTIAPQNTGSNLPIPWSLTVTASWAAVNTTSGLTGSNAFTVRPILSTPARTGIYAGALTVASSTTGQQVEVALSMEVIDGGFSRIYLPMTSSGRP
jgi:hypothetical protein